jgi:YHS domain-containing protein
MSHVHHRRPLASRITAGAVLVLLTLSGRALALDPVHKTRFGGVAIDGYDPVAYFDGGQPLAGSKEFSFTWQGATWRFASATHRDLFAKDPERYAPRYGGYCAWAVGHGYSAAGDPQAWSIVDDRLYLNYNQEVKAQWAPDARSWIAKGDLNWPRLVSGEKLMTPN